jgi:hypothetical protein
MNEINHAQAAPSHAFDTKDRIFLFIALALGFLLFELILFEGFGIAVPVYMALLYAAVFWYFSGRPGGIEKKGLWLFAPIALLSACFALYDNILLSALDFMLLYALVTLQLTQMTGNRLYKTSLPGLALDIFHAGAALPVLNAPAPFLAMKRRQSPGGKLGRAAGIIIGLAISIPVLCIVLALLSSADPVFQKGLRAFFSYLNEHVAEYILKVVFGAIAAIPLFGFLYALRVKKPIRTLKVRINTDRVRIVDGTVAGTVAALLCAVYLVFVLVQFGYLFNAFQSVLPSDFTYAEYARRGFFELMGVSVVNFCVLGLSMLFSRREGAGLRALETALVALTLLLLASAFAKMAMYMDAYGLTPARVYASWFMLLLAVFFIAMLVKLHVRKFALVRFCGAAFLALFLALNFAGVDARVAQYNIDNYESGKFKTVDVNMFYGLSDSMVPYAAKLLDDGDKGVAARARELLADRARILDYNDWQTFSAARQTAKSVIRTKGIAYQPWSGYGGPDD